MAPPVPQVEGMPRELALLTPLRGFAALAVVLLHAGVLPRGYLAVDFFFMLSGFVLSHVHGAAFTEAPQARPAMHFLWLRLCRIYPVHAAITLCLMPQLGTAQGFSLSDLVVCLLLGQVLLPYPAFNDMAWSVSAEWFAYLAFPLLAWGVSNRVDRYSGSALAAALAAIWWIGLSAGPVGLGWHAVIGRTLPEFLAGMLAYRCYDSGWLLAFWRSDAGFVIALTVTVAIGAAGAPDGAVVALLPAVLLAAAANRCRIVRWLGIAPLRFFGEASYSIYLAQSLILLLIHRFGGPLDGPTRPLFQAAMIAGSVGAGMLFYRCVEQPSRQRLRTLPAALLGRRAAAVLPIRNS